MKRKMRICKKNTWRMGKKKKKIAFSPPIPQGLSNVDSEAERRGQAACSDSLPMASWKVAFVLGVNQNVFYLMPSLSVGSVRMKSEEAVSFGEPLVTVCSSGGGGRPEGCHQGQHTLPPVWLVSRVLMAQPLKSGISPGLLPPVYFGQVT